MILQEVAVQIQEEMFRPFNKSLMPHPYQRAIFDLREISKI